MNILSEEQLETYRRQGWKVFQPGFDISYKSQWNTPWFIIREFFQNALDEHDEARITTRPRLEDSSRGVIIEDQGRGLGAESLLLRETKGGGDLRGRFGEGLKFACISAVRQNFTPVIESTDVTIQAYVSGLTMGKAKANLLTFIYKESRRSRPGTRVTIEGYHGDLYRENFTTYLGRPLVSKDRQIGRFLRREAVYDNPKGNLYVGDIFIKKFDQATNYSYNLWEIELNPDRVSEIRRRDVIIGMARPWSAIANKTLAVRLLQAITAKGSEESNISWGYGEAPPKELMLAAWKQLFGYRAVLWTGELEAKLAGGYGYNAVGMVWSGESRQLLRYIVPLDSDMVEARVKELTAPTIIPPSRLTDKQRRNLEVIRFLTDNCALCHYEGKKPEIVAATIPVDPRTQTATLGLCAFDEGKIYMSPEALSTEEDTISVYYHEMGHWVGGEVAIDGTMSHTFAVQNIAARLSLLMRQKTADIDRILGVEVTRAPVILAPAAATEAKAGVEVLHFESGGQKYVRYIDRVNKRQWTVKVP